MNFMRHLDLLCTKQTPLPQRHKCEMQNVILTRLGYDTEKG